MYPVPAAITMDNASSSLADLCNAIDAGETDIGLDGLAHSDSAALAVILAAIRHGQVAGKPVRVGGVPPAMRSLAKLYGIEGLIGAGSGL